MKKIKLWLCLSILLLLSFSGCSSNGYSKFYTSNFTVEEYNTLKNDIDLVFLKEGEEPKIFSTDDINRDGKILMSKNYSPIGYSDFYGPLESESNLISQAKKVRATMVLCTWEYRNTNTNTGSYTIPTTNYETGTVYSGGQTAYYTGTTTESKSVPYSYSTDVYDQSTVFFVKNNKKYDLGINYEKISREKRIEIDQDGILITMLYEDTPAYRSNLLVKDIIIKINNEKIKELEEFWKKINKYKKTEGKCVLTVVRNGVNKNININFNE